MPQKTIYPFATGPRSGRLSSLKSPSVLRVVVRRVNVARRAGAATAGDAVGADPLDNAIQHFGHIQRCGTDMMKTYNLERFMEAMETIGSVVDTRKFGTRTIYTIRV